MSNKNVEFVVSPPALHWVGDGFRVHNFIPGSNRLDMERMTPFILLDYNSTFHFPPSEHPRGVGVHPHRGFETVSIAIKGKIAHHDSTGSGGVIGQGDVQWMTAAAGILHKEYHEEQWSREGGEFQMVQLWVNLPAKHKMSQPKYQAITQSQMGKVLLPENAGVVEVIAGEYGGISGPATTFTPMHMMIAKLNPDGKASFHFPEHYTTALLVLEGEVLIHGTTKAPLDHFVLFENKGESFDISSTKPSKVLILSGEPIHEPIAAHGPFVMNTRAELIQAFDDFNKGKFGYLED